MEENFDQLRKLLALKRYEVPPPGFFNNFSSKVIARIEAGHATRPVTWLQKLGLDFNFKPALVCGLGVVVCGLLSAGVLASVSGTGNQPVAGFVMGSPVGAEVSPFGSHALDAAHSSTQPVFSASRFDHFSIRTEPASYQFGK